jgi:Ctr copper transporter family
VVVFAAVAYHAVRYLIYMLEDYMHNENKTRKRVSPTNNAAEPTLNDALLSYQQIPEGPADKKTDVALRESSEAAGGESNEYSRLRQTVESENRERELGSSKYIQLRLLHSLLSGYNYGVALLLMLVAMTYNPALFLALVVGYTIGDYVFYARMTPRSSSNECHLICAKT